MPTNANTFNSRVTSEALEAKFRQVFPAQGGAELVQDLFASGVIQPVVDFSTVAEGSVLPENLQTAWDFSTGQQQTRNATNTLVNNTGFWLIDLVFTAEYAGGTQAAYIALTDGLSAKPIWKVTTPAGTANPSAVIDTQKFVVYVRAGESIIANTNSPNLYLETSYRQIADVNGTLVNPLGFTFS